MKLRAEDTAALFIDFQERLVPAIHDNEAIVEKTVILAKGLQEFGVPVAEMCIRDRWNISKNCSLMLSSSFRVSCM